MIDELERTEAFERLCGSPCRAEQLLRLYMNTSDNRTSLDKLQGSGRNRAESFRQKAKAYGFTDLQVDALLILQ